MSHVHTLSNLSLALMTSTSIGNGVWHTLLFHAFLCHADSCTPASYAVLLSLFCVCFFFVFFFGGGGGGAFVCVYVWPLQQ